MTSDILPLAADFPESSESAWEALVTKALNGADLEKRLVKKSADGLTIRPLYTGKNARALPRPPEAARLVERPQPWDVAASHAHPDLEQTNKAILEDLSGGVSAITLALGPALGSARDLETTLKGVHLPMAGVNLDGASPDQAGWLLDLFSNAGAPEEVRGNLGLDPLGAWARQGGSPKDADATLSACGQIAARAKSFAHVTTFVADERWVHEAGGTNVQGLAAQLSTAVSYLRRLAADGFTVTEAARQIQFTSVTDSDLYAAVAKLRALKILWTRIIEASDGNAKDGPIVLTAQTSRRALTRRDPYVNILRGCAGGFAAALGGASAITVLPFTEALGYPTARARRVARNTQVLLAEESSLGRVDDPAAGSYAFEDLTRQTAESAWATFQAIEAEGGLLAALQSGSLAAQVAEAKEKLLRAVATRKEPLTGTSEFPHLAEAALDIEPFAPTVSPAPEAPFPAFEAFRLAEPFEACRDKSDAYMKQTGHRPRVLLWPLGTPADDTPRITFARNFFEALGIEALIPEGDPEAAAPESRLAILCSSDALYKEKAAQAAKAAKAKGIQYLYLAGAPGELKDTLTAAGVDDFIFMGCDLLKVAQKAYAELGDAP
ncbi:MAG: methylmalonyl-CoA mutase [Alphaproteobacteria bacterium]|nr:MAG: methylmalonyl-CoA mutase [Alphaproteobacteria bacterium]